MITNYLILGIYYIFFSLLGSSDKLTNTQQFQGKAFYFSKTKMELGAWGARMSEAQKKQIKNRLKKKNYTCFCTTKLR